MNALELLVCSPTGINIRESVIFVKMKTLNGEICIYHNHTPLISVLETCVLSYKNSTGNIIKCIVGQGIIKINDNTVNLMTDYFNNNISDNNPIFERNKYISDGLNKKINSHDLEFHKLYTELEETVVKLTETK